MHFLSRRLESDTQWRTYRQLEGIPDTVPNPAQTHALYTLGLGWAWRGFIGLLVAELEAEDRLEEYFERCLTMDISKDGELTPNSLQKLWALMD